MLPLTLVHVQNTAFIYIQSMHWDQYICTFSKTPKGLTILRNGEIWQTVTHCCPLILWEISVKNFGKHAETPLQQVTNWLEVHQNKNGCGNDGKENDYAICSTNGQIYFCCGRTNICCNHWCGLANDTKQASKEEKGGKLQQWPQTGCMFTDNFGSYIRK